MEGFRSLKYQTKSAAATAASTITKISATIIATGNFFVEADDTLEAEEEVGVVPGRGV